MKEFRYTALTAERKTVQGIIAENSKRDALKRIREICIEKDLNLLRVEKKHSFIYKVQKNNEKPIKGEQRAYSREDVVNALQKMGYKVLRIEKKLFDFHFAPPTKDVVMFIRLCADMLREKLSYDSILTLLLNDMENKTLKQTIREINQDLKDGKEGKEVFGKHQSVLGKFPSYMLGVATTSGDMTTIYDSTAKFLERIEDFKKNLKQALVMPLVIIFFLFLAIIFYVAYIFPKTAEMFIKFDIELPPMTQATLEMSNFLKSNVVWLLLILIITGIGTLRFIRSPQGRLFIDKMMIRIPVVGPLMHKMSIEIFARVFYGLYSGSGENINALRIAAEACRNSYMERQIKEVALPLMVREGAGLITALERSGVFTRNALSRLRSGAETGTLKMTSLQLADYYEKETKYKLSNLIDLVNISISVVIMFVMIGLTLVSSETALIKPKNPLMH